MPLLAVQRLGPGRLAVARKANLFNLVLGSLQQAVAMRLQRLSALVDADRLVERDVAALKVVNDLLQCIERLLEAHLRDILIRLVSHDYPFISRPTWAATENASPCRS